MNTERAVILSVLFLGLGVGLIFGFSHDSSISLGGTFPVPGPTLGVVLHTDGLPALAGLISTAAGVLFLFVALVLTVLKLASHRQGVQSPSVRAI